MNMKADLPDSCELCQRSHLKLTKHHLIPATLHTNKWFKKRYSREELNQVIWVCRPCHNAVHRHISHKELGREFNTLAAIRTHTEVAKFVEWVKNKS